MMSRNLRALVIDDRMNLDVAELCYLDIVRLPHHVPNGDEDFEREIDSDGCIPRLGKLRQHAIVEYKDELTNPIDIMSVDINFDNDKSSAKYEHENSSGFKPYGVLHALVVAASRRKSFPIVWKLHSGADKEELKDDPIVSWAWTMLLALERHPDVADVLNGDKEFRQIVNSRIDDGESECYSVILKLVADYRRRLLSFLERGDSIYMDVEYIESVQSECATVIGSEDINDFLSLDVDLEIRSMAGAPSYIRMASMFADSVQPTQVDLEFLQRTDADGQDCDTLEGFLNTLKSIAHTQSLSNPLHQILESIEAGNASMSDAAHTAAGRKFPMLRCRALVAAMICKWIEKTQFLGQGIRSPKDIPGMYFDGNVESEVKTYKRHLDPLWKSWSNDLPELGTQPPSIGQFIGLLSNKDWQLPDPRMRSACRDWFEEEFSKRETSLRKSGQDPKLPFSLTERGG